MTPLDPGLALATVQLRFMEDRAADGPRIIRDCPVAVLAERVPPRGRYNDRLTIVHRDGWARSFVGNTSPGRVGLNKLIGKYYAEARLGLIMMIKGRHKLRPNRFRQCTRTQALELGLPSYFSDPRAKGYFHIDRLRDDGSVAETVWDCINLNFHDGGETKTGSSGCITAPPSEYAAMRDLLYAAMTEGRQTWLPIVITQPIV